jgi:hypothetical protein
MSTNTSLKNDTLRLAEANKDSVPLWLPEFTHELVRWATTDTENVEKIAEPWQKNTRFVRLGQSVLSNSSMLPSAK